MSLLGDWVVSGKFITYLRVSTKDQGKSGLGLAAQQAAIDQFLSGRDATVLGSYVEVESGKNDNRPELRKAVAHCRRTDATLLVAKLDRLSRSLLLVAKMLDEMGKGEFEFVCADNPHATRFTLGILAAVAQHERELISQRTRDALAAAKAKGKALGGWRGNRAPDHKAAHAVWKKQADAKAAEIMPAVRPHLEATFTSSKVLPA